MRNFSIFLCLLMLVTSNAFSQVRGVQYDATVTTSSALVIEASATRKYLLIQNKGSTNIFVKVNSVHVANEGVEIVAGGNWEPSPESLINSFYMKSSSGSDTVSITEGK